MLTYKHDFGSNPHLLDEQVYNIYKDYKANYLSDYSANEAYYRGENPYVLSRIKDTSKGAPDWKIPVSYARKIINTIVGYMYKPGNIKYVSKNEQENQSIDEIFQYNIEPVKTAKLGRICSTFGVAYELHYLSSDGESAKRMFVALDPREIIPIYNYDIEPLLQAAIRFYMRGKIAEIEVYYSDVVIYYRLPENADKLALYKQAVNPYKQVPIIVFKNNEEEISDFQPVKKLIDAYDILTSDSMNEFDRYAWAYLLLKEAMDPEKLAKLKELRVFENLDNPATDVSFLTKEIPYGFIQSMVDIVRFEIHNQSHVPNFIDIKTGEQTSGVALDRLLYDFEFIAATKEAYFKQGLYQRLELLDRVIDIGEDAEIRNNIDIIMKRNKPTDKAADAALFNQYYKKDIPTRILIKEFASFVEDPEEAMKEFADEQSASMETLPTIEGDEQVSEEPGNTQEETAKASK